MAFCALGWQVEGDACRKKDGDRKCTTVSLPQCLPEWNLGFQECQMDIFGVVGKSRTVLLDQPLPPAVLGARPYLSSPSIALRGGPQSGKPERKRHRS